VDTDHDIVPVLDAVCVGVTTNAVVYVLPFCVDIDVIIGVVYNIASKNVWLAFKVLGPVHVIVTDSWSIGIPDGIVRTPVLVLNQLVWIDVDPDVDTDHVKVPTLLAVWTGVTTSCTDTSPDWVPIVLIAGVLYKVVFSENEVVPASPVGPVAVTTAVVEIAEVFWGIVITPVDVFIYVDKDPGLTDHVRVPVLDAVCVGVITTSPGPV
jgi:hypothetical protein